MQAEVLGGKMHERRGVLIVKLHFLIIALQAHHMTITHMPTI